MSDKQDKMWHQFKSSILSCKFILSNGKNANFVNGIYRTDLDSEVAELQEEIKQGHPYISYLGQVSAADLDPISVIKKKAVEEYLAQQALTQDPKRDMGQTAENKSTLMASAATSQGVAGNAASVNLAHLKK
jgi:hypothetical protein